MTTILGRGTVLFVDPDDDRAAQLRTVASSVGYNCTIEHSARAALRRVKTRSVNVIAASSDLTDLHMDTFIESLSRANYNVSVIIYGKNISAWDAIRWMRAGVVDILLNPANSQALRDALQRAFARSSTIFSAKSATHNNLPTKRLHSDGMLYRSKAMAVLMKKAARVAPVKVTVLVSGESGTGKDVLAAEIHSMSGRRGQYIAINCAAIPETLLESELFGYERGAFTGADARRKGKFEAADRGTLLLDEIGDMPLSVQAKLLRVLEEERITRLGGNTPVAIDVRLIAATHRDLSKMVEDGTFREDLYYRLKVIELSIPPLRSRKSDIPLLAVFFLRHAAEKYGLPMPAVDPEVIEKLKSYPWPGNVRQLKNMMESLLVTASDRISVEDLPHELDTIQEEKCSTIEFCLPMSLIDIETEVIKKTLNLTGGNRARTAQLLGIGRRTLQRKLESFNKKR